MDHHNMEIRSELAKYNVRFSRAGKWCLGVYMTWEAAWKEGR